MIEREEIFGFKFGKVFIPIFKIPKFCFHKKCPYCQTLTDFKGYSIPQICICKNKILKRRITDMKITKGQTALIVIAIAGTIGALIIVNLFKAHPIYGASILIATLGIVIGALMYKRNKDR